MIGYTIVGTNELDKACQLHDPIFADYGQKNGQSLPNKMNIDDQ